MCYWVGTKKVRETLFKIWQENPDDEIANAYYETFVATDAVNDFKEYGVAIGKGKPELSVLRRKSEGGYTFNNMTWTLKYSYTNKENKLIVRELLNSTCERAFWQHKDVIYKNRCIIPVDGYYEFFHYKGNKYPHLIYPKNGNIMYLGGIFDENIDRDTGEIKNTMSIITVPPNSIAQKLHNNPKAPNGPRMLLILDREQALNYINPEINQQEIKEFFKPYDDNNLSYHPVVRFLSREFSSLVDSIDVQKPVTYPEIENVA